VTEQESMRRRREKGAPQAQQIADKFHILKNLRDGLKELMARKQKVLPEVEEVSSDGIALRAQGKQRESAESEGAVPGELQKRWRSMSQRTSPFLYKGAEPVVCTVSEPNFARQSPLSL